MGGVNEAIAGCRVGSDAGLVAKKRGGDSRGGAGGLECGIWLEIDVCADVLARLAEKGFVSSRKEGKTNRYTACVSEAEYQKSESVSFVQRLFAGSVKDLVASLAEAGSMSDADVEELQAFLEEQKGGA